MNGQGSSLSNWARPHHVNELLVVDLAITIGVYSLQELGDLIFTESEIVTSEACT